MHVIMGFLSFFVCSWYIYYYALACAKDDFYNENEVNYDEFYS